MSQSHGSSKAWYPAGILLSVYAYAGFTYNFAVQLEPSLFLPLLTGWLGHRFGPRIVGLLLLLGLLAAFSIGSDVTDTLSIGLGISVWIYFLAICAAVVFSRPKFPTNFDGILHERWRWFKWLLPAALWLAVYMNRDLNFEFSDSLVIGTNPGFLLFAIVLLACFDWGKLIDGVRPIVVTSERKSLNRIRVAICVLLALAVVVYVEWEYDYWFALSFGFTDGFGLLLAIAFAVTATGIADWRLTILFLALLLASEWPINWLFDAIQAAIPAEPTVPGSSSAIEDDFLLEEIVITASFSRHYLFWPRVVDGVTAVLMAIAIAPFLQQLNPDSLKTRRAGIFLSLALVTILISVPLVLHEISSFGFFVIGGVAFVAGLRWRIRGIILAPLIIQVAYLPFIPFSIADYYDAPSALGLVNIGLVAFPFAYFGMLSNRLSPVSESQNDAALTWDDSS